MRTRVAGGDAVGCVPVLLRVSGLPFRDSPRKGRLLCVLFVRQRSLSARSVGLIYLLLMRLSATVVSFRSLLFQMAVVLSLVGCAPATYAPLYVRGDLITFTGSETSPNGAWCWFQDERAIVDPEHPEGPMLQFTSISASGTSTSEQGDVDLHYLNIASGRQGVFELYDQLEQDDHNAAALFRLDDGRTMALFSRHGSDQIVHMRVSGPHDPTKWSRITEYREEAGVTYNNLLTAGKNGSRRLFDFSRSRGWNPNFLVFSPAEGKWKYGGRLLASDGRPYMKYRNNRDGSLIHVVATDQHPRDFDNSIYHGIMDGMSLLDSYGNTIDADLTDQEAARPIDMTLVFRGDPDNVAWMADVEVDQQDRPVIAFSVQKDGRGLAPREGGMDHRYHLARFIDGEWVEHEIAYAGQRLYPFEDDYTGLVAIDPQDPNRLVISTNAHPDTGEPLISAADSTRHYELYEGVSTDDGATFTWTPLTANSSMDNIRPIIPSWDDDRRIVLWMRGTYHSYTSWNTQIVGLIQERR